MEREPTQSQIFRFIAGYVLEELMFQVATESSIPQILKKIQPMGTGCVFRDSLVEGCSLMIRLLQALRDTKQSQKWNLIQIMVIGDDDTASKNTLNDAIKIIYAIGQLLDVKTIKIIIMGMGLSKKAQNEIQSIMKAGGQKVQYHNIGEEDIETKFTSIAANIGLQKRLQSMRGNNHSGSFIRSNVEIDSFLQLNQQNYAVLFNLDVSGMQGQKWKSVCEGVKRFVNLLGENDIISAIVFNQQVRFLVNMSMDDQLFGETKRTQTLTSKIPPTITRPQLQKIQKYDEGASYCRCQIM